MEKISVVGLIKKYINWLKKGEIQFIREPEKIKILSSLEEISNDFIKADRKAKESGEKANLSEHLDWAKTHKLGTEIWKYLASCALNNIERGSKGNSQLFDFLKAATEFEDLLYGLEPFYRDHTLHSLWVYFLGEYILREQLPHIHTNLNWFLFNDIENDKEKEKYSSKLLNDSAQKEKQLHKDVNTYRDAIWCLMALCHDLGYSLAKLKKVNEKAKKVLEFFDLPDYKYAGYSLDIEHQYNLTQFLELMAMDVRIVPSQDKKDSLIKCYRDDSTFWRLCRALEKKQHGILSSYLLYKILDLFAEAWVRGTAEQWGLEDEEARDNIIRGDILYAIAQHEFDFAHLDELSSLADILVLADDLEEFSRYGRQLLSRKYFDTTAEVSISFKPNSIKQGESIDIEIVYDVAENAELKNFFIRKAENLCKKYSLSNDKNTKYSKIKSIKMTTVKNEEKYFFQLCEGYEHEGSLPKAIINGKTYKKGIYKLSCNDDKLHIDARDGSTILLEEWFENAV